MIRRPALWKPAKASGTCSSQVSASQRQLSFRFASVDRWLRTPAPTMGQHNHEILVDDLGLDEDAYQALVDASVIGDRPLGL